MHPSTPTALPPEQPPAPLHPLLDLITNVLSLILLSSLTVRSFIGRWQILRLKLTGLQSSLFSLADSSHWSENPLLHTLLPSVLSTLQRLKSLSDQCASSFSGGKLLMQSDLDIASSSLSAHLRDLDLLLRSGVLRQQNAIVLSHPAAGADRDNLAFFIRDVFTRLQIGSVELKKESLDSLLQLLTENEKSAGLVAKEGNVGYLVNLLNLQSEPSIREQAVAAVSLLTSSSEESRKIVFEEGGLGPLLRTLEAGSLALKEKAAAAVEAITTDPENAWAISAYSGVSVLVEVCRSGSPAAQDHVVGAVRNVAALEDIRMALTEEGAVSVLLDLLISGSNAAQAKSANCIAILASSGEYFRDLIVQERGLQKLMHSTPDSVSSGTLEYVLRSISFLSVSDSVSRILSSSTGFIIQLGEIIKNENMILQQISASLLANLSLSDGNKRAIASCMASLIKLMESPKPVGLQDSATQAAAAILTVQSNRKELLRDEKSVTRLVQMLDPRNETVAAKNLPVMVTAALLAGGNRGCRKRLIWAGADRHLQRLAELGVPGAKKALQRLTGNRLKSILFARPWKE